MYKKVYLFLAALMIAGMSYAQEAYEMVEFSDSVEAPVVQQKDSSLLPTDSLGIHPWNDEENDKHIIVVDQSHWSMYLAAGFNIFDGDYTSEKKHAVWFPTLSLGGAYHWNNTWAVGAEYKFRQYRVTGNGNQRDADILLKGMAHQAWGYVSFDIFNAFRPQNKEKLFALDLLLGGGAIFKKNSLYYGNVRLASQILRDTPWDYNTANETPQSDNKYKVYGVFVGGVSAEFNINRSLQLGLRALYNYTTSDEIDGRPYRGQNNDGIFDCELLLRYKFQPRKKSNVRNFMTDKTIEDWNDGTQYQDSAIGKAKRDKYKKPYGGSRDTIVIITRDTVWMMGGAGAGVGAGRGKNGQDLNNYVVYFENDVPELDKVATGITEEAADWLNSHPERYAVVIGSCDNTGAVEYNQWLAVQRANNVTKALEDLGVENDRIYTVGRGIMQDDRAEGSYKANRRVEIRVVSEAELAQAKVDYAYFEQYKNVKRTSAVRKAGEGKYASSSEALKAAIQKMKETGVAVSFDEIVNAMTPVEEPVDETLEYIEGEVPAAEDTTIELEEEVPYVEEELLLEELDSLAIEGVDTTSVMDVVEVTPNMTLSKLARQYYGNGNLWVNIFEANREVLASPDLLEEGMRLVIPKL